MVQTFRLFHGMESCTASYFKIHFGAVLDRAGVEPVRIERRGRRSAILIPESEYREIRKRASASGGQPDDAFSRLKVLALGPEIELEQMERIRDSVLRGSELD